MYLFKWTEPLTAQKLALFNWKMVIKNDDSTFSKKNVLYFLNLFPRKLTSLGVTKFQNIQIISPFYILISVLMYWFWEIKGESIQGKIEDGHQNLRLAQMSISRPFLATSKWPSELQFCERYSTWITKKWLERVGNVSNKFWWPVSTI